MARKTGPAVPTPAQKQFAEELGVALPEDATRLDAHRYIAVAREEPQEWQLREAARLGVTVPEGATRKQVRDIIDRAVSVKRSEALRAAGLRRGSIVAMNPDTDGGRFVLAHIDVRQMGLRRVPCGTTTFIDACTFVGAVAVLGVKEIFTESQEWIHSYAVRPVGVLTPGKGFRKAQNGIEAFIRPRLAPEDRKESVYGEYWRASVVEALREQFRAEHPEE